MNSTFIAIYDMVHPWSPVFIWLVFISWGHFDVVGCTREVRFDIVYLGVCPENEITEIEIDTAWLELVLRTSKSEGARGDVQWSAGARHPRYP